MTGILLSAALAVVSPPKTIVQGGIAEVRVTSDAPVSGVVLVDGDRRIALEGDASGRTFRGLWGVDLDAPPGERALVFEAADGSRASAPARVVKGRFAVQKLKVDPKYVEVPPEERERVKADGERVAAAYRSGSPARRWTSFARPVAFPGSNFGSRRVYNGRTTGVHSGLDMSAPMGTPVAAPADARVVLAGNLYFSGGTVLLDHGAGLFTMLIHLSRVDVKEGDVVARGTVVGRVGATGRATGPHLHWAAKLDGARVNPEDLLRLAPRPAPPPAPPPGTTLAP